MMPAMRPTTVLSALLLALAAGMAHAQTAMAGAVRVGHVFATPSIPGSANGAAYLATLENTGPAADRLVRASTAVATRVELHSMAMDGGTMRMREIEAIAVPPNETLTMRPGQGFHLMLMQLKAPLKAGDTFPLVLEFEKGGRVEVKVEVHEAKGAAGHKH